MNDDLTFTQTYKASELVSKLQELISKHGDQLVVLNDPDTGWLLEIGVVYDTPSLKENLPARFEIMAEYSHQRPMGHKQ